MGQEQGCTYGEDMKGACEVAKWQLFGHLQSEKLEDLRGRVMAVSSLFSE